MFENGECPIAATVCAIKVGLLLGFVMALVVTILEWILL